MTKYVIVLPFPAGTKGVDNYYCSGRSMLWDRLVYAIVYPDRLTALSEIKWRREIGTPKWENAVIQPVTWKLTTIGGKESVKSQ